MFLRNTQDEHIKNLLCDEALEPMEDLQNKSSPPSSPTSVLPKSPDNAFNFHINHLTLFPIVNKKIDFAKLSNSEVPYSDEDPSVVNTSPRLNQVLHTYQLELIIPTMKNKDEVLKVYFYNTQESKVEELFNTLKGDTITSRHTHYRILALRKKEDHKIIGCIHYDSGGKVNSIVIDDQYQNKNLGSLLLACTVERDFDIPYFYLDSTEEGLPMYIKFGFRPDIERYKMKRDNIKLEEFTALKSLDSKWFEKSLEIRISFEKKLNYSFLILDLKDNESYEVYQDRINYLTSQSYLLSDSEDESEEESENSEEEMSDEIHSYKTLPDLKRHKSESSSPLLPFFSMTDPTRDNEFPLTNAQPTFK